MLIAGSNTCVSDLAISTGIFNWLRLWGGNGRILPVVT